MNQIQMSKYQLTMAFFVRWYSVLLNSRQCRWHWKWQRHLFFFSSWCGCVSYWIQDNIDEKDNDKDNKKTNFKDTCFPVDVVVFSYWIQDRRGEKWDSGGRAIFDTSITSPLSVTSKTKTIEKTKTKTFPSVALYRICRLHPSSKTQILHTVCSFTNCV